MVMQAECTTPAEVVALFAERFLLVQPESATLTALVEFLTEELGGVDVMAARSYMEQPLRKLLHQMLSLPEYQLG